MTALTAEPTQPSVRRMRDFGIRPKRDLGQNFLVDSNILDVIAREAELGPDDVVLEVGGGLGVLSEHLAARARHVHVVELDRNLEPALRDATAPFANVTLHFADAVKLDHAALDPPPDKVVANLPYNVAATVILQTVADLPGATRWVAMVQKEVGERLAAQPGGDDWGAFSVFAQFHATVRIAGIVPRGAFFPPPKVDSAVVHLVPRREPPVQISSEDAFFAVSRAAFGQRRKTIANALAGASGLSLERAAVDAALEACGVDAGRRGETLTLAEIAALSRALFVDRETPSVV